MAYQPTSASAQERLHRVAAKLVGEYVRTDEERPAIGMNAGHGTCINSTGVLLEVHDDHFIVTFGDWPNRTVPFEHLRSITIAHYDTGKETT